MAVSGDYQEENVSFIKNLLNRRVPQILGIYLAIGWGLVQFVDWIAGRYLLSPYLTDLTFVIFISMIPSCLVITYYHGSPGNDRWVRIEKAMLPVNIVATFVLAFFLFQGKDLGALSQTVTLEDETGQTIERTIPKNKYRKKMTMFYFENKSADSSIDWLQYGIPYMLEIDLNQDQFLDIKTPAEPTIYFTFPTYEKLKEAGYQDGLKVPLSLKKKLSQEAHKEYFLSGTVLKENEIFTVESSIYKSKNAKLVTKREFQGKNIFQLIDDMSIQIKKDLDLPKGHLDEVIDLPLEETFTKSIPAAQQYTLGQNACVFESDWSQAKNHFEKAIKKDPTFAYAYLSLLAMGKLLSQPMEVTKVTDILMKHMHRLPERMQYLVKLTYYDDKKQSEKVRAILKMMMKMFPNDPKAFYLYALLLEADNKLDEAITINKKMLEIDPTGYKIYTKIGSLYQKKGDSQQALQYYKKYTDHFPDDPESLCLIGDYYKETGNYLEAKKHYEQVVLIKPEDIGCLVTLAKIEMEMGNFDKAINQYQAALKQSKSETDRAAVYEHIASFYMTRGQMYKAHDYLQMYINSIKKYMPPIYAQIIKTISLKHHALVGKESEAFKQLEILKTKMGPPLDNFVSVGYIMLYLELENAQEAEKRLPAVEKYVKSSNVRQLMGFVHSAKGEINELKKDYRQAIKDYEAQLKINPTDTSTQRSIGRCYRHLKQYEKAGESIRKNLDLHPFSPSTNYELAMVYLDQGQKDKAKEYLQVALDIWKDADKDYKPAKKAREKMAEIEGK